MSLFNHLAVKIGSAFLAFNSVIGFLSFSLSYTHGISQIGAIPSCVPAAYVQSSSALSQQFLFCSSAPVLSKLVYLFDHSSKQSTHTLIDQTLHVMDRLLVR